LIVLSKSKPDFTPPIPTIKPSSPKTINFFLKLTFNLNEIQIKLNVNYFTSFTSTFHKLITFFSQKDNDGNFSNFLSFSNYFFKFQYIDENEMKIKIIFFFSNNFSIYLSISFLFIDKTINSFQEQIHFFKSNYEVFLHFPIKFLSIHKILFEISESPFSYKTSIFSSSTNLNKTLVIQSLSSPLSSISSQSTSFTSPFNIPSNHIFNLKQISLNLTKSNFQPTNKLLDTITDKFSNQDSNEKFSSKLSLDNYFFSNLIY
jgi:hypothetical protein